MNRLLSVLFVPAIACGGGGSPTPVPVDTQPPDTAPPVPVACPATGLGGSVGTDAMPAGPNCGPQAQPVPCDWYSVETMGPNTGTNKMQFAVGLPDGAGNDLLIVQVLAPFTLNTPINFITDAASDASYPAATFILNSENGMDVDRLLFAGNGSITLTATSEAMDGLTKGSITPTMYREVDDAGAPVAGGCMSTINNLAFVLKQGSATFAKETAPQAETERMQRFKGLMHQANVMIDRFEANQ